MAKDLKATFDSEDRIEQVRDRINKEEQDQESLSTDLLPRDTLTSNSIITKQNVPAVIKRLNAYASWLRHEELVEDKDVDILVRRMELYIMDGVYPRWESVAEEFGMNRDQYRQRHRRAVTRLERAGIKWPPPRIEEANFNLEETDAADLTGWQALQKIKVRGVSVIHSMSLADVIDRLLYLVEHSVTRSHTDGPRGAVASSSSVAHPNASLAEEIRILLNQSTGLANHQVTKAQVGLTGEPVNWMDSDKWRQENWSGFALVPIPENSKAQDPLRAATIEGAS